MKAGENVGALVRNVRKDSVRRGMVLCQPGTVTQFNQFKARIYVRTKGEGGRIKPLMTK